MKKVVLLGATGPSGLQVLKVGLQKGYEIRAVVRDPAKITQTHENLKVNLREILSLPTNYSKSTRKANA